MTSTITAREQSSADLPAVGGRFRPILAMRRNLVEFAEHTWRAHGDVVRTVLGPPGLDREMWLLHHPDAAARVLSGSSWRSFTKEDPGYTEVGHWFGRSLLTADGEEWTRQKRLLQPAFTKPAVEGYGALMVEEIEQAIAHRDRTSGAVVDLGGWMQELTLKVVVRALFGQSGDEIVTQVRRSLPAISDTVVRRGSGVLRLPASVPTPRVRRGRAGQHDLFAACDRIVATRRAQGPTGGTDLLSRLLAAQDDEAGFTDDEVRSQVLVFLLAGHDTTAIALTFALHLLGRHPEVQDAVRDEVRDVVGDERPTAAAASSLVVTNAVLREAMRLYPSVPFVSRLTVADDELLGYPVRAGTTVLLVPWTIHRHPDFWRDPLVFDPSRFAPTAPPLPHRYAWMPFGGGPRACIGQHFAMVEALLALAVLLREHRVTSLASAGQVPVSSRLTLCPTEPVRARVERLR
ncbi:MAG: cytochrome P450 [Dermatophilaceae bacterium]